MSVVLIIGGGLQGVSSARSLKEVGHEVGMLSKGPDFSHKSSALSFVCIDPLGYDKSNLISLIEKHKIDVIIPMNDTIAYWVSGLKEEITKNTGCKIAAPDVDILDIAGDKQKLMELCKNNGIPHPETYDVNILDDPNILKFPLLIKPNHSIGSRGITRVYDINELKEKLPIIQKQYGECHLQEYIDGNLPYFNVMVYRDANGKLVNSCILEIRRFYPIKAGSSSMCVTVENDNLVEICKKVLDIIGYVGFADFDVLQNKNGEYKIIEINPRVPASLRGAAISGINFPDIIVNDALGLPIRQYEYVPNKTLRYLGLDIMWFLESSDRFKSKPSWFKFIGKDTFYQEGGWKDWKPMLYSFIEKFKLIKFKNGKIIKSERL